METRKERTATELAGIIGVNNRILERLRHGEYGAVRWYEDAEGKETFIALRAKRYGILGMLRDDVARRRLNLLQVAEWQAECLKYFGMRDWAWIRQGAWSSDQLQEGLREMHSHLVEEINEGTRRRQDGSH